MFQPGNEIPHEGDLSTSRSRSIFIVREIQLPLDTFFEVVY